MNEYNKILQEVIKTRKQIWLDPPEAVKTLRNQKLYSGTLPGLLYVNFYVLFLTEVLYDLRNVAERGDVPLNNLNELTSVMLGKFIMRFPNWGQKQIVQTLERSREAFNKYVKKKEEYIELVEELLVYSNKMQYWIDGMVPWFELDERVSLMKLPVENSTRNSL